MKITDKAKELLEAVLSDKGAKGIRLYTVAGCCGTQYAINIDPPKETDTIQMINGIQVAIDSQITSSEELTLDKEENQNSSGLVLLGASGCC